MASLESEVMMSFSLVCEVIKDTVVNNIQARAAAGEISLTNEQFSKLTWIVRESVDQAARNSSRQLQASLTKKR